MAANGSGLDFFPALQLHAAEKPGILALKAHFAALDLAAVPGFLGFALADVAVKIVLFHIGVTVAELFIIARPAAGNEQTSKEEKKNHPPAGMNVWDCFFDC